MMEYKGKIYGKISGKYVQLKFDSDYFNDLDLILNNALNEAICSETNRIKNPNSNKISQFVIDFLERNGRLNN